MGALQAALANASAEGDAKAAHRLGLEYTELEETLNNAMLEWETLAE
jgi:hypothetical protein